MCPQLGSAQAFSSLPPLLELGRGKFPSVCINQQGIPDNALGQCEELQTYECSKFIEHYTNAIY